ncbi:hypothetical protein ES703_78503 [subsurface metagenome]
MEKRSEVFQKFGPKLLESFLELILSEFNELRTAAGLPPRTKIQIYDQITNHFSNLPDYEWQDEE